MDENDIQIYKQRALDTTNTIFENSECNICVRMLTAEDLDWYIALQRQQPVERRLPWDMSGAALTDPHAFNFSFKILDADQRPAGACICQFLPATQADESPVLNVEMIQNFHIKDSILDGNMLRFALYAAILFMAETKCEGLRLISPINEDVADYYINVYGFIDICGKEILYRDAEGLFQWLQTDLTQVEDEQKLSDNLTDD